MLHVCVCVCARGCKHVVLRRVCRASSCRASSCVCHSILARVASRRPSRLVGDRRLIRDRNPTPCTPLPTPTPTPPASSFLTPSHPATSLDGSQFLAVNAKSFRKHPLFKAGAWLGDVAGLPDSGVPSWHAVPVGLLQRVYRKGKDMTTKDWLKWYHKSLFPKEPDYYRSCFINPKP
jgi:hypothetical protein